VTAASTSTVHRQHRAAQALNLNAQLSALDSAAVKSLLRQVKPMAVLSITHLTASTRQKLAADDLSINAYPNEYGAFIHVGAPRYAVPTEADLAAIFDVAEQAGIVWLKFESDAAAIDGLTVFEGESPIS
jgi:hypothetical protein